MEPFDPTSREFTQDPFPILARYREQEPVHYSELLGGWMVTKYDDVTSILRDSRFSSDRISPFIDNLEPALQKEMCPLADSLKKWALYADPPYHTRLRGLLNTAFTTRAVECLEKPVADVVDELLEPGLKAGRMEFIEGFAYPLPANVICAMLGIPRADSKKLMQWSADIEPFIGLAKKPLETYHVAKHGSDELSRYFAKLIQVRKDNLGDDLLSGLIRAMQDDKADLSEVIASGILLVFAAHRTTAHLIGNGLYSLIRNPEQFDELRNDPSLIEPAIDELIRYDGPIQVVRRVAKEPLELRGKKIAKNDLVFSMFNAANRDPEQFPDPDRLDFRRPTPRHVGFSLGIHYCTGAPLARLEARLFLKAMAERTKKVAFATSQQPFSDFLGIRGLQELEIEITT